MRFASLTDLQNFNIWAASKGRDLRDMPVYEWRDLYEEWLQATSIHTVKS